MKFYLYQVGAVGLIIASWIVGMIYFSPVPISFLSGMSIAIWTTATSYANKKEFEETKEYVGYLKGVLEVSKINHKSIDNYR